jgi:hypothetical protein
MTMGLSVELRMGLLSTYRDEKSASFDGVQG